MILTLIIYLFFAMLGAAVALLWVIYRVLPDVRESHQEEVEGLLDEIDLVAEWGTEMESLAAESGADEHEIERRTDYVVDGADLRTASKFQEHYSARSDDGGL